MLGAGYYDSVSVSTDIKDVNGTITYQIGHKHIGDDVTKGGCYTKAIGTKKVRCATPMTMYGNGDYGWGRCPYCGKEYASSNYANGGTARCPYDVTVTQYAINCGHEEGEYIRDTNDMNDVGSDEYIISATIKY